MTSSGCDIQEVKVVIGNKSFRIPIDIWSLYPEHSANGEACWCEPTVVEYPEKDARITIHNDFNA